MKKPLPDFEPGIPDEENPEWNGEDFAKARPFKEAFPELYANIKRHRGPQRTPTKRQITLRLDAEAVERFKATGPGWQAKIDEIVKAAAGKL